MKANRDPEAATKARLRLAAFILAAAIVVAALALVVRSLARKTPGASEAEPTPVAVMLVEKRHASEEVRLVGKVEPIRDVTVAVEIGGRYIAVPSDVGDSVDAGDILVKIDDSVPKAAKARAEAEFQDSRRELGRLENLLKRGAVSESAVDSARTRLALAEGALAEAEAWLAKCSVTSPIAGRIEEKYIETGEYALDGNSAFRIADLSRVKVVVYVPERDIASVRKGDKMTFSVIAMPKTQFEGEVTFAARAADDMNHAFRVELAADNSDGALKGGMIADVTLRRQTKELVAEIPFTAVLPRKGEHIVFLHEDGRAVRRTVRIHAMVGEHALISSGLEPGEQLVVQGQKFLQDGRAVTVAEGAGER